MRASKVSTDSVIIEYLDELINNVKNKVITVAQAVDEAREKDVNWDLIGINSEDDLIECLEIETA